MDISLQRFAEYHALEGAFGRRAVTERAKGILMERDGIDEQQAFHLIREEARRTNTKMVDIATSLLASHRLLSSGASSPPGLDPDGST
jgi:response regulator NasT